MLTDPNQIEESDAQKGRVLRISSFSDFITQVPYDEWAVAQEQLFEQLRLAGEDIGMFMFLTRALPHADMSPRELDIYLGSLIAPQFTRFYFRSTSAGPTLPKRIASSAQTNAKLVSVLRKLLARAESATEGDGEAMSCTHDGASPGDMASATASAS